MMGGDFIMAYFKDLSPCTYFDSEHFPINYKNVVAVGWIDLLKNGKICKYKTGKPPRGFISKLKSLTRARNWYRSWFNFCGWHESVIDGNTSGSGDFFIPYKGKVYAAPFAIIHYVVENEYLPPKKFIDAVMDIDIKMSMRNYLKQIRDIDERFYWLMRSVSEDAVANNKDMLPWADEHKVLIEKDVLAVAAKRTLSQIEYDEMKSKCEKMNECELADAIKEALMSSKLNMFEKTFDENESINNKRGLTMMADGSYVLVDPPRIQGSVHIGPSHFGNQPQWFPQMKSMTPRHRTIKDRNFVKREFMELKEISTVSGRPSYNQD